jgi:hypothetical protein
MNTTRLSDVNESQVGTIGVSGKKKELITGGRSALSFRAGFRTLDRRILPPSIWKGSSKLEGKLADKGEFAEPPSWISAWARNPKLQYVEADELLQMTDEQLLDELLRRTVSHCEVISGLAHS